jgi:hypothetical protein
LGFRISQRKFTQSIKKYHIQVSEIPYVFYWYSVASGFWENLTAASDNESGLNGGTSFGGRLNGARRNERDLGEKDEL